MANETSESCLEEQTVCERTYPTHQENDDESDCPCANASKQWKARPSTPTLPGDHTIASPDSIPEVSLLSKPKVAIPTICFHTAPPVYLRWLCLRI